jgi:hypothetical protein
MSNFRQLIEDDRPVLKDGQHERRQKDLSIERRVPLNEFSFTGFLLSGFFKELFEMIVICFSRVRCGQVRISREGDLSLDHIFLTLLPQVISFRTFNLDLRFKRMDT